MDKPKKKGPKYPLVSEAYPYEYQKAIKDSRMDLASLYFALPPEQQQQFGDVEVFINSMTGNIDAPIQIVDRERGPDFKFKTTDLGNLLSGAGVGFGGYAATGQVPFVNQMITGDPANYSASTGFGEVGRIILPGAVGAATFLLRNKNNPSRYQAKSREALQQGLNDIIQGRVKEFQNPEYLPYDYRGMKADMSEFGYYPNAQNGMMVQGEDQMGGGMEDILKNQIYDDLQKNYSEKNMIIKPFEQEQQQMEYGGQNNQMPVDIAVNRFKAAGKEKGMSGAQLNMYVEKMKSKYGYQKGGSVYSTDVEDYYMPRFEAGGKIQYKGHTFPGYNKSISAPAGDKYRKMAMIKKGDKVKLVKYGFRKK
jgi:hypothetical protein